MAENIWFFFQLTCLTLTKSYPFQNVSVPIKYSKLFEQIIFYLGLLKSYDKTVVFGKRRYKNYNPVFNFTHATPHLYLNLEEFAKGNIFFKAKGILENNTSKAVTLRQNTFHV